MPSPAFASAAYSHYDEKSWPVSPSSSASSHRSPSYDLQPPSEKPSGTHAVRWQGTDGWDAVVETAARPIDVALALPHFRSQTMPAHHRLSMYVGSHAGAVAAKVCRPPGSHAPFYLEVYAEHGDVTLWLPSDFRGTVRTAHPCAAARTRSRSSSTSSSASSVPPAPAARRHALAQPTLPRAGASATSFSPLAPSPNPSDPRPVVKFSDGFTNRILPHARVDGGEADGAELDDDAPARADEVRVCARRVTLRMWDVVACAPERRGREAWRRMFGCAKAPETVDWDFLVDE